MRRVIIPAVLLLVAGSACWPFDDDAPLSEMTLRVSGGSVEIRRGEEIIDVSDRETLQPDDVVVTSGRAVAVLRLEGDRRATLGPGSRVAIAGVHALEAQAGRLLAQVKDPTMISFGDVESFAEEAIFRLDRSVGTTRVGTYRGAVRLSAPGHASAVVPEFFQTSVAAGQPQSRTPLRLAADDWDRRFLSAVIDLHEDLRELQSGLALRIGGKRPGLGYFRALSGRSDLGFMRSYIKRPVPDLLTGFVLADNDREMPFKRSFRKAFDLHDAGGAWGVVAAIMQVPFKPVVAQFDDIVVAAGVANKGSDGGVKFSVASARQASDRSRPAAGGRGASGSTITSAAPRGGGSGGDDGGGGEDPQKPKPKPTTDPNDCGDAVECAAEDAISKIQQSPSPSPSAPGP